MLLPEVVAAGALPPERTSPPLARVEGMPLALVLPSTRVRPPPAPCAYMLLLSGCPRESACPPAVSPLPLPPTPTPPSPASASPAADVVDPRAVLPASSRSVPCDATPCPTACCCCCTRAAGISSVKVTCPSVLLPLPLPSIASSSPGDGERTAASEVELSVAGLLRRKGSQLRALFDRGTWPPLASSASVTSPCGCGCPCCCCCDCSCDCVAAPSAAACACSVSVCWTCSDCGRRGLETSLALPCCSVTVLIMGWLCRRVARGEGLNGARPSSARVCGASSSAA